MRASAEASSGMRCYGAAALEMAEVAAGGAVVYAQPLLQPWDVAAGALLCTETGVVLTRMDGSAWAGPRRLGAGAHRDLDGGEPAGDEGGSR